jgi:hypothetical protein
MVQSEVEFSILVHSIAYPSFSSNCFSTLETDYQREFYRPDIKNISIIEYIIEESINTFSEGLKKIGHHFLHSSF